MSNELARIDADEVLSGTMKAKRARFNLTQQDIEIFELHENGVPHTEIAAEFNVNAAAVRSSVRSVEKHIKSGLVADVAAIKGLQYLRLEGIRKAAMNGYQKTTGTERTVRRKTHKDGTVEETITEKASAGDPRYLNVAMRSMEAQRGLFAGIEVPKGIAHTNFDGTDNPQVTLDVLMNMPMDQLEVLDQASKMLDTTLSEQTGDDR